jgi:hypothetical protein
MMVIFAPSWGRRISMDNSGITSFFDPACELYGFIRS